MLLLIDRALILGMCKYVFRPNEFAFEFDHKFCATRDACLVTSLRSTTEGTLSNVDTPSAAITAHTHGVRNYEEQDCFVGWPSGEDMRWTIGEAQKGSFVVHLCVALEGTYAITVNPLVSGLSDATIEALMDDVFRYFSSRHGHRCGQGAVSERFPCAMFFLQLACEYRFSGQMCQQFAGAEVTCARPSAARVAAAKVIGGRVFAVRFLPHTLSTRDGGTWSYEAVLAEPEAHRDRIRAGSYVDAGIDTQEQYVRLSAKGCDWLTHPVLRRLPG
jgi:hypothetical protein